MKYLLAIYSKSRKPNATIFETRSSAKKAIAEIRAHLAGGAKLVRGNGCFYVRAFGENLLKIRIIEAKRAEYRLVRHATGIKDEERRFSLRENAVNFVRDHCDDSTKHEDRAGAWFDTEHDGYYYKLYAAVLAPETGSKAVVFRYDAATVESFTMRELGHYCSAKAKPIHKKTAIAFACATAGALSLIGVALFRTDWQLIADEKEAQSYQATAAVEGIADDLSLTRKGRAIFLASHPILMSRADFNRTCGRDGSGSAYTAGCYYKDSEEKEHLEIFDSGYANINENGLSYDFVAQRKITALHEMLHAAWERLPENKQTETCGRLRTLSRDIRTLSDEVASYPSDQICTELFARVGSEYIPALQTQTSSAILPIRYSALSADGKAAVAQLEKLYADYFDTSATRNLVSYWANKSSLDSFAAKAELAENTLRQRKEYAQRMTQLYYSYPTWNGYYAANNAISSYNESVRVYNSYVATAQKLNYALDSEYGIFSSLGN